MNAVRPPGSGTEYVLSAPVQPFPVSLYAFNCASGAACGAAVADHVVRTVLHDWVAPAGGRTVSGSP